MVNLKIPCPHCTDGFTSAGDRHARTKQDVCGHCGGEMMADARTGETPETSYAASDTTPAVPMDGGREAQRPSDAALFAAAGMLKEEIKEAETLGRQMLVQAAVWAVHNTLVPAALTPSSADAGAGLREALETLRAKTAEHANLLSKAEAGKAWWGHVYEAEAAVTASKEAVVCAALAAIPEGAGSVGGTEKETEAPIYTAFARYVGNADERASDFRMFATGFHAALSAPPVQADFAQSRAEGMEPAPAAQAETAGEDALAVIDRIVAEARDISGHIHMGGRSLYRAGQRLRSIADDLAAHRHAAQAGAGDGVVRVPREKMDELRFFVRAVKALMRHTNPHNVNEGHAQQWFAVSDAISNKIDPILRAAAPIGTGNGEDTK